MESFGVYEVKTHLPRLLARVREGESLLITRHGHPVAQLVPVERHHDRAQQAAERIRERRARLGGASLNELIASIHEGHRH